MLEIFRAVTPKLALLMFSRDSSVYIKVCIHFKTTLRVSQLFSLGRNLEEDLFPQGQSLRHGTREHEQKVPLPFKVCVTDKRALCDSTREKTEKV